LTSDDHSGDAELDALAEEFVTRHRQGESPSLSDYVRRYPHQAAGIRELFPAFLALESMAVSGRSEPLFSLSRETPPTDSPARPGRLGDYRILREIGRGGMGIVYEAEHISLGQRVALKILSTGALSNNVQLQRFQRESRTAAQLHHTNIVPVFGVGECQGLHYYVMQFIPGRSLDKLIEARRLSSSAPAAGCPADELTVGDGEPTPATGNGLAPTQVDGRSAPATAALDDRSWNAVARIGLQTVQALDYASRRGVLHRDIKPSNLLLGDDGTLWITDFGLAKVASEGALTETGDVLGTLRYMAPETLHGKFDERSDLFSLGLTLYELLALRPAYTETARPALLRQIAESQVIPLHRLTSAVPRDLETIVMKAIAHDPATRYPTARAMADDLERFLADQPIHARRAGTVERLWRWSRRNPLVAGLVASIASLLVVVAVGSSIEAILFGRLAELERGTRQKAQVNLTRAEAAEQEVEQQLWSSLVEQAKAQRHAGAIGQRFGGLKALTAAARIRVTPELRNEAIGCLALADIQFVRSWDCQTFGDVLIDIDPRLERYAIADRQGNIRVCRISDNMELHRFAGDGVSVGPLFSGDGRYLIGRTYPGGHGRIWDLQSDQLQATVDYEQGSWAADVSADGRLAALGLTGGGPIRLHALPSGELLRTVGDGAEAGRLRFAPSGRQFAVSRGTNILVYDGADGSLVAELPQSEVVLEVEWRPPGDQLAATCADGRLVVWDVASRECIAVADGPAGGGAKPALDPAGDLLTTLDWSGRGRFWDPRTGSALFSTRKRYNAMRFASHNRLLTVVSGELGFELWKVAASRVYQPLSPAPRRGADIFHACATDQRGRLLAAAMQDGIALFELATGRCLATLPTAECWSLEFEGSDTLLACGPGGVWRWPVADDVNAADGPTLRIGPPKRIPVAGRTCHAASSADSGVLAVSLFDGAIVLRADRPDAPIRLGPQDDVRCIAVSPNGRWIATGSHGGRQCIKVWDAENGNCVREFPQTEGSAVEFSPDGGWLIKSSGHIQTWEVETWRSGVKLAKRGDGVVFSPDGKLIAIGAYDDEGVRIVDFSSGRELAFLPDPQRHSANAMRFAGPDGAKLVVIAGDHHALHVWDLPEIAKGLAEIGLKWDLPEFPPKPDGNLAALKVIVDTGSPVTQ
jgi:serine/threonine protein kinase/WD40 repeat protein